MIKLGQPIDIKDRPILVSNSGDRGDVVDAILRMAKAIAGQKAPVVHVDAPSIQFPENRPAPTEWVFTHEYDNKGNIVRSTAKAKSR